MSQSQVLKSGEAANLECGDLSPLSPVAEPLSPFGGAGFSFPSGFARHGDV